MRLFLVILALIGVHFLGGFSHENDIVAMCKDNGQANLWTTTIECRVIENE